MNCGYVKLSGLAGKVFNLCVSSWGNVVPEKPFAGIRSGRRILCEVLNRMSVHVYVDVFCHHDGCSTTH